MRKYRNNPITVNGITYDSTKEYQRYLFLLDAERRGIISELKIQVPYELLPSFKEIQFVQLKTKVKEVEKSVEQAVHYIADFTYKKDGEIVVEDVKGSKKMITDVYVLKRKMMLYFLGIRIREVYSATEKI